MMRLNVAYSMWQKRTKVVYWNTENLLYDPFDKMSGPKKAFFYFKPIELDYLDL